MLSADDSLFTLLSTDAHSRDTYTASSRFPLCLLNAQEAAFETSKELIGRGSCTFPDGRCASVCVVPQVELAGRGRLHDPNPSAPITRGKLCSATHTPPFFISFTVLNRGSGDTSTLDIRRYMHCDKLKGMSTRIRSMLMGPKSNQEILTVPADQAFSLTGGRKETWNLEC
jgi:hypothetical protein